ncbi:molybdenum cofactor guanylyltransferase [Sphingopyxis sp.]|uniref:molybdenum cofactor guanylyltransferase n=1 Tax=Sphingopyxis sp. TaxID=1908224 RepID=UPI002D78D224|nr:molybdenum cofactor guanylyltransferase [Sphingopyxis sp.]HET6523132.1 molybdenum cofactor guanylyltransferase [Sphingopyxis sp.]
MLAGGQSRRFGSDKAAALYRGRALLDHSLGALRPYAEVIFVAGRQHGGKGAVADRPAAGLGPLGGICGALFVAREQRFTHLLCAPCDTPEIPEPLLQALVAENGGAYVASCPVLGFWPSILADHLEDYLEADRPRSMRSWADAAGVRSLTWDEPIHNVNHPSDIGGEA